MKALDLGGRATETLCDLPVVLTEGEGAGLRAGRSLAHGEGGVCGEEFAGCVPDWDERAALAIASKFFRDENFLLFCAAQGGRLWPEPGG